MTRHRLRDTDAGIDENDEEEVIRLARRSAELHYSHELDVDIDAVYADLRQRVPAQAPPQRSGLHQAWASFWQGCRQLPWNWRALRLPYPLMFCIVAATTIFVILRALTQLAPEIQATVLGVGPGSSQTYAYPAPVADQQIVWRHAHHDTQRTRNANRQQPLAPRLVGDPTSATPPLINIKIGRGNGSLVSLIVTLTGRGGGTTGLQANISLAVAPAAATCSLSHLADGDPEIPQLLAALKAPIHLTVKAGLSDPLVVQLSPTGVPAQPLACSMPNPNPQPDTQSVPQSGLPAATSSPGSLSGALDGILEPITSILPH